MKKEGKKVEKASVNRDMASLKWGYIPLSIFKDSKLSAFESIVKFLKENLSMKYREIADLTNRSVGAVSATYIKSSKKEKGSFEHLSSESIPITIFLDRKFSVLENLVRYLSERNKMDVNSISIALGKNVQTIYTILRRIKIKDEKQE